MTPPTLLRATHASGLSAVERELAAMHSELLRLGGEEARMVRLSVVNLVAVCETDADTELASRTIAALAQSFPARTIVVQTRSDGSGADIEADLSLQSTPRSGLGPLCSEQVRLSVQGSPARHLESVITPLLVADVPLHLWIVGRQDLDRALSHAALARCERVIVNSGAYADTATALRTISAAAQTGVPVADLAWARTRPWRERIAQCFDGGAMRPFARHISAIEIDTAGGEGPASGWLLAGWLVERSARCCTTAPAVSVRCGHDTTAPEPRRLRLSCDHGTQHAEVVIEQVEHALRTRIAINGGVSAGTVITHEPAAIVSLVGGLVVDAEPDGVFPAAAATAARLAGADT